MNQTNSPRPIHLELIAMPLQDAANSTEVFHNALFQERTMCLGGKSVANDFAGILIQFACPLSPPKVPRSMSPSCWKERMKRHHQPDWPRPDLGVGELKD